MRAPVLTTLERKINCTGPHEILHPSFAAETLYAGRVPLFPVTLGALAVGILPAGQAATPPERTIQFSGHRWAVRSSGAREAPGPNHFSDSKRAVWVDRRGRLHLRTFGTGADARTAEVVGTQERGFGTYTWVIDSSVRALDPNVVLGLFTWSNEPAFNHREIDVEYARWGSPKWRSNGQFAVQPAATGGNLVRVRQQSAPHATGFTWSPRRVEFFSKGASPERWTYTINVPPQGTAHPRMNLWRFRGRQLSGGRTSEEVIIRSFAFVPWPAVLLGPW